MAQPRPRRRLPLLGEGESEANQETTVQEPELASGTSRFAPLLEGRARDQQVRPIYAV